MNSSSVRICLSWLQTISTLVTALGLSTPALASFAPGLSAGEPSFLQATPTPRATRSYLSSGHVTRFRTGSYSVAVEGLELQVRFTGARNEEPEAIGRVSEQVGMPTALGRVQYKEVWPSIDLSFDSGAGILRSTYILAPGADPSRIELDYGVSVHLAVDGSLQLFFPAGMLSESVPDRLARDRGGNKAGRCRIRALGCASNRLSRRPI